MHKTSPPSAPEETIIRLFREHRTALTRLCYACLHDASLADDAVQETYLKACRHLHRRRPDASEKAWLTAIAVNTCRDMRRSAWFRLHDRHITPDMLPEPAANASQEDREVTLAVMNLPGRLRETVLMHYFQGLTTQEIARTLGISHQAVSDRLRRARERLRPILERSMHDE